MSRRADDGRDPDVREVPVGEARRHSRRSFAGFALGAAAAAGAYEWTWARSRHGGIPWPLRASLDASGRLGAATFDPGRLAPTFDRSRAEELRVNGDIGLRTPLDLASWSLTLSTPAGRRSVGIDDVRRLPKVEQTTEHKCIEGWSTVVHWGGVRLRDLVERVVGRGPHPPYVALATPDLEYYVGLDTPSALHRQTLLAYEMNGRPLTLEHGAPLRLVVPVKYGIKSIKRVGVLAFSENRPADYWAERGYDWYSGH